ncbi:DUF6397 family protein [Streptomyces longispororuber]|uniref:DUF6397 family protein n=1 Tax=Streptomyces longispororuber TaxID=68230 RepID=UPI0033ECF93F
MTGDTQTISQPVTAGPAPPGTAPTSSTVPTDSTVLTGSTAPIAPPVPTSRPSSFARSRAARELGLKRGEFELAVMLGHVRTVADPTGMRRRVGREEIDRLREAPGFPKSLRDAIETVGTADGAALLDIPQPRFTRLARAGLLTPVKFYLNRYRTVVWLYLAQELREFAACEANAPLLTGRAPDTMRALLASGADLRPRNWRRRHVGFLLRQSEDPWERAAITASFLDPVRLAHLVPDPYERAYLHRLRPEPLTQAAPESPTTHLVERITTADDPDEISWLRVNMSLGLAEARRHRPAPRPGVPPVVATPRAERLRASVTEVGSGADVSSVAGTPVPPAPDTAPAIADADRRDEPRGLLRWLRRRRGQPEG